MNLSHALNDLIQQYQVRLTIRSNPAETPGIGWAVSVVSKDSAQQWMISACGGTLESAISRLQKDLPRMLEERETKAAAVKTVK